MSMINNRTPIDNLGEKLNLYRETTESIEDFQNRVYVALNSLKTHKYSFRDSLFSTDAFTVVIPDIY